MGLACAGIVISIALVPVYLAAQTLTPESPTAPYPPRRTFGVFGEYSPDSSHIFLGVSRHRQFYSIGGAFTQRLAAHRAFTLFYLAECRPFILWSDPILKTVTAVYTSPPPAHTVTEFQPQQPPVVNTYPQSIPFQFQDPYSGIFYQGTEYFTYGRRYVYAGNLSPIGFKLNLRPQSHIQPILTTTGGMVVSFRDLPVFDSSAFNFTFSFGVGMEWFQNENRSLRVEYRVQHISNAALGAVNPGVDSQLIQTTWNWGKH
jgi:Lipid A 3-O-deacylase (PagL)